MQETHTTRNPELFHEYEIMGSPNVAYDAIVSYLTT